MTTKTNNTKARHQQILDAANDAIKVIGGVEAIDALPQGDRKVVLRLLKITVYTETDCAPDTARRNVAKALKQARHPLNAIPQRGGARPNSGPDPWPEELKRERVSTRLAPGSHELAKAIAEIEGLSGWGQSVDVALAKMVHEDDGLRMKLAKRGIIVKANDGKGL